MEDNKNAMKLVDEKLDQVAGGSGHGTNWYTECPVHKVLCEMKELYDEEMFRNLVVDRSKHTCPAFKDDYECVPCDVNGHWLR